jgi:hypothetical protein
MPFAPRRYLGGSQELVAGGKEHEALLEKHGWRRQESKARFCT